MRDFDADKMTATIEQRGKFEVGMEVEFFQPQGKTFKQTLTKIFDEDGQEILSAPHAQQIVKIPVTMPVENFSLMRCDL